MIRLGHFICLLLLASCVSTKHEIAYYITSNDSVKPGTEVEYNGSKLALSSGQLSVGDYFFDKSKTLQLGATGRVSIVSVIPAIKTPTCEAQTHLLSESESLATEIDRIVISADSKKVQKDFSLDAGLTNLQYYSDAGSLDFAKSSGLLIEKYKVLARAVLVLDEKGFVRYMQVVPDINQLPDMEKAFEFANSLVVK